MQMKRWNILGHKCLASLLMMGIFFGMPVWAEEARAGEQENDSATAHLSGLLSDVKSWQARFEQTLLSPRGQVLQSVTGELKAMSPGYFYWVTEAPMAQTLVSDGEQVWLYDPDLEQVTVQPVNEQAANTPALLLSGQVEAIAASYDVAYADAAARSEQRPDFRLTPKAADSLFVTLTLHFAGGILHAMSLEDSLGQKTLLRFSDMVKNPDLAQKDFFFRVPEGVDVIRQVAE